MAAFQFRAGIYKRLSPSVTFCDDENPEAIETKKLPMEPSPPSCFICEKFPVNRRLREIPADDRHGASIYLKKKECTIACAVHRSFNNKNSIRNESNNNVTV